MADKNTDWGLRTREHEFSTGRSATLRRSLPLTQLMEEGLFDRDLIEAFDKVMKGKLENAEQAARLMRVVCESMFVDPKISGGEEGEKDGERWVAVPFHALEDEEVKETIALAFESIAGAAGFRGDGKGSGDGRGREAVADKPKRPPRKTPRKR